MGISARRVREHARTGRIIARKVPAVTGSSTRAAPAVLEECMTTDVQDPQADAAAAKNAVDEAEADLRSGRRSISADVLHKITDAWRHADLTAEGARQKAEQDRREARLSGLAAIGEKVDELARAEHAEQLADALRAAAAACNQVPRPRRGARRRRRRSGRRGDRPESGTGSAGRPSEHIRLRRRQGHVHRPQARHGEPDRRSHPGRARVRDDGDPGRAVAAMQAVARAPEAKRPDHLLRNPAQGCSSRSTAR